MEAGPCRRPAPATPSFAPLINCGDGHAAAGHVVYFNILRNDWVSFASKSRRPSHCHPAALRSHGRASWLLRVSHVRSRQAYNWIAHTFESYVAALCADHPTLRLPPAAPESVSLRLTYDRYKSLRGAQWTTLTLLTAFLYPGMVFFIFFFLNFFIWGRGSSAAVPFGTIVALISMWFCISVPLVFLGAFFGEQ